MTVGVTNSNYRKITIIKKRNAPNHRYVTSSKRQQILTHSPTARIFYCSRKSVMPTVLASTCQSTLQSVFSVLLQTWSATRCRSCSNAWAPWTRGGDASCAGRSLATRGIIITSIFPDNTPVLTVRQCTRAAILYCCTCALNIRRLPSN